MQMPDHLVQIIPEAYELLVYQPLHIVGRLAIDRDPGVGREKKRSPKMNRPHADAPRRAS